MYCVIRIVDVQDVSGVFLFYIEEIEFDEVIIIVDMCFDGMKGLVVFVVEQVFRQGVGDMFMKVVFIVLVE